MVVNGKIILLLHMPNNLFQPGIGKLLYVTAHFAHNMLVLFIVVGSFKLSHIVSKLMFDHQFTLQQQINGIVKSGPAHPVVLIFHKNIERFYIKMTGTGIYLIQDGIPFRCLPMAFLLQIRGKHLFYSFF